LTSPLFRARVTIGGAEIAAPYDFGFQLRHYVIAPEVREGEKLVEVVRLSSGGLVKVDVVSRGTVEVPRLELTIFSAERLPPAQVDEVRERVAAHLNLEDDLRPFHAATAGDPVLSASIEYNFGAKGKRAYSMFDGLIDVLLGQNTVFRRVYAMRATWLPRSGTPSSPTGASTMPRRPPSNSPPPRWRRSGRPGSATGIVTSKGWPRPSPGAWTWRRSDSFPAPTLGAS
jgi:hypothetical protein